MGFGLRVVGLVLFLFARLIGSVIVGLIRVTRIVLPLLWRIARYLMMILVISIIALRVGLFTSAARIAQDWVGRFEKSGFPIQWDSMLYKTLAVLAFFTIIAGWVLISIISSWGVNILLSMLD